MNGNAAKLPGLGTFKLKVTGKAKENIDDVTSAGCTVQVVFDVDPVLASQLKDAKFQFVPSPPPRASRTQPTTARILRLLPEGRKNPRRAATVAITRRAGSWRGDP